MKKHNCGSCLHWDPDGEWIAKAGFEHGERGRTGQCRPFETLVEDYSGCLSYRKIPLWYKILRALSR